MTILAIQRLIPRPDKEPEPIRTGFGLRLGDVLNHRDFKASKKVDDISRHESKHDEAPKHEPRINHRERPKEIAKPGTNPSQGGKGTPGTPRS
jgi:hypothetical protein